MVWFLRLVEYNDAYTGAPSEPGGDDTSALLRLDSSVGLSPLASMLGVISLSGDVAWP